jgi:hypothetical protein
MKNCEPYNLREWSVSSGRLFTCGRPGRGTYNPLTKPVPEYVIDLWVRGLPSVPQLSIISLLGYKPPSVKHPSGLSEFAYYPFRSCKEGGSKPTFQDWLISRSGPRFSVEEFPTLDRLPIVPDEFVETIRKRVRALLESSAVVIVVDSAGVQRTGEVCGTIGILRSN